MSVAATAALCLPDVASAESVGDRGETAEMVRQITAQCEAPGLSPNQLTNAARSFRAKIEGLNLIFPLVYEKNRSEAEDVEASRALLEALSRAAEVVLDEHDMYQVGIALNEFMTKEIGSMTPKETSDLAELIEIVSGMAATYAAFTGAKRLGHSFHAIQTVNHGTKICRAVARRAFEVLEKAGVTCSPDIINRTIATGVFPGHLEVVPRGECQGKDKGDLSVTSLELLGSLVDLQFISGEDSRFYDYAKSLWYI